MNYLKVLLDLYKYKNNVNKTREQIEQLQDKKLRKLLYYAYDNSKYYREAFEKAKITREKIKNTPLSEFPSIDKNTLINNFDNLITVSDITQEEYCSNRWKIWWSNGSRRWNRWCRCKTIIFRYKSSIRRMD